ncbi:nesprin-2-like [Heterodontus francisci]|uniref:nesprin-2-like n=1 Tax=Heterodontus francisci TaxID=7792 RepID=UPI00355BE368
MVGNIFIEGETKTRNRDHKLKIVAIKSTDHEQIQKRTFTNWVNTQLAKHETPSVVQDLFQDLRDGHRLLDLLEVLSGQQLDRDGDRSNPIHWRSNIETVLKFLRKKSIKLVNINIPDVVEGKPTIVLGMIWSIILHFHIEELASGLQFNSRQTQVEPSLHFNSSPTTSSPRKRKPLCHAKWKVSAKKALLQWVQEKAKGLGINVHNFSTSWRSGLAFVAIINALRPGLLDPQEFKHKSDKENLEIAFKVAEQELKIPRLLEAQDVDVCNPDPKSIITYVSQFLQYSQTGELKTQCSSGSDQHECGIRERSAQQVGSGTDQSDHLGSEDSAQSAAAKAGRVVREAPAKLRAAEPSRIIQTDIQRGEIPGQSTEWISIRIDDLERDGHTQSVQEAPTGKLQSDWLQSSLSSQSMTHYPIGKEPLADVGECSGQLLSRDVSPNLPREDFAQLLAQFLTVEGQATDQARGSYAQVVAVSPRRQVVALAPEHSGQQAEDLLTGKCEVDRFPRVDITQLAGEPQGGQGQSDVPPRGESAPLASKFPSEQHQGDLQTREGSAQLQKESTMWKAQVIPRTGEEAAHVARGSLIQQQQPVCQVTELGKEILTAELCLTGEDQGEGLTLRVHGPLSGDEKADRGFVRLAAVAQGQSDQPESPESLTGGEQGKDLTLSDKSSLIVAEKIDSRTKEPSVRWVTTMLREEADSPVREECASSATGDMTRKEQAYGLPGENSDQLPINEQSQVHTQTTGNTVQFLSGRGQNYGLPRQAPPQFVGASQSEQHQVPTRMDSVQYTPEFVCEQEQTGSPATEGPAQLAKYLLFGMDQAYGLAVEDCKLSAVSVSARDLTEDQASQGLARLIKPSPVGEDKFDHPTNEESSQLSQLILSGGIQACGLSGEDSEQLLSESLSEQEADADLAREDSSPSGSDRLMERVLKGREKEDISQAWEDRSTGKGQTFGPLAVDSREIFLRERELAGSMTTRTSDPLAAVTVSGQPREDSVPPAEESLNERGQADGLVRKDSAGAGKDSLNGDEKIDSTVSVPALIQFQSDQTNTRESLASGDPGEDLTLSQEGPLTRAEQSDTQTRNISVNRESVMLREQEQEGDPRRAECAPSATGDVTGKEQAYGRPREDSDQLPVGEQSQAHTQATGNIVQFQSEPGQNYGLPRQAAPPSVAASQNDQHQVLTRDVSAQYPPEIVSEQEQTGGAITQKDQDPGLSLSEEGALSGKCTEDSVQSAEMILHEPEQAGDWECGKSTQLLEELLSWEGQARVALAESAPVLQIGDQANKQESESFPHWILLHQNLKEVEDSAPSLSYSPNAGEQSAADSAVLLSGQGQGNRLVQEDAELLGKEPVATKALSGVKSSQPLKKPLDGNNLTDILASEDSGKSALSMKQEFAGDLRSSSVDLSETRQQDKETEGEEDQSITGNEEKEGDIDAVNEISQRYETAKETFESSLKRVEGLIVMDLHSQPTISDLREKFQEMQAARAEVTSLLSAFDVVVTELQRLPVAAPHTRISETNRLRGESAELLQTLHHREEFMSMALNVLETVEQQLTQLHNSLLQFQNKPKILTGLNLKHEPDLQMLKNLQTQIKSQIESCEELQSTECEASITLDRGDHRAVCAVALGYTQKCQEIGLQVQVAEEALRALDGFLQLLRAVEHKEGSVREQEGAVQAGKARLEEEEGTRPLQDRALELDETLTAAKICLEDGNSGGRTCCRDLAVSLGYKAEGARLGLEKEERAAQEGLHKTFCTRQSHLINVLREIEKSAGEVQLSEATLPGVQQRLRSLNDLNSELQSKAAELSELRELTEQLVGMNSALRGEAQEGLDTVEKVWEETERNIHDWQDQCCVLVAFLREFQNYKKDITSTIQKGEDVIPECSSYMGKEKLHRVMCNIDKVHLEFCNKQEKVDELRKICRHLQSELRKVMDSESLPFQGEADELLDRWLDVAERLDSYSSSLKHAMSLWEQLTETGTRIEEWVKRKSENLGASMSGQELARLEEEIQFQEQEIQSFHEKATRIQELLEWEEAPLELQVVESMVRKKMEQINCIKNQLSAGNEELSGGLGQSGTRLQTLTASLARHIGEENPQILCDPQDRPPASESRVGGQQCFQHSLGEHKEPVQSGEDPMASSDDEVTPTAEELPQVPRMVLEQSHKPSSDGQPPGDTDLRRRQHEALEEVTAAKRCRESQELQMEGDWIRLSAAKHLLDTLEAKQENVEKYPEKLREYVTDCRQLSDLLDTLETSLKGCAAEIPTSYKAAIEQVERQSGLGREIDSIEMMLVDLRKRAVNLEQTGEAGDGMSGSLAVSRLSDHWLCLQDSARKQELYSRSQREEWKTMSEQIDRVTIVLDHLQDDLPDGPREQTTEAELQALEEYVSRYADELKRQQSALAILVCRVTSVLGVQDASDQTLAPPVLQELRAMEGRCRSLTQKIEKSRRDIEEEVQEREKTFREINGIDDWLQQARAQLESINMDSDGEAENGLEQLRDAVNAQQQAMAEISGQLQNRYSAQYTTIPAEIATRIQETSRALGDMEGKLKALGPQNTRSQELSFRIEAIRSRLQNFEEVLQQRSKSHSEAKAQQKRIWREIDEWHSVLSKLDAEVQDLAEQDPEQAEELMESLLDPFQQHQQVSRIAEQRTTRLSKIPECLEEYKQITDSAASWIESTEALLSSETDYTSAKSLGQQLLAFQVSCINTISIPERIVFAWLSLSQTDLRGRRSWVQAH